MSCDVFAVAAAGGRGGRREAVPTFGANGRISNIEPQNHEVNAGFVCESEFHSSSSVVLEKLNSRTKDEDRFAEDEYDCLIAINTHLLRQIFSY